MTRIKNIFYVVAILASANSIIAEESGHANSGSTSHHISESSNNGKQNPFGIMMDGFSSFSNLRGSGGTPFSRLGGSGIPFSDSNSGNPFGGFGGSGSPFSGFGTGNPFGGLFGSGSSGNGNPFSGFASAFGFPSFGSRQENTSGPKFDMESNSGDELREVNKKRKRESDKDSQSEEQPENRFFFSSLFNTRLTTCNYTTYPGATCSSCREVLHCRPNNVGTVRRCGHFFPYCNNGRCSLSPGAACTAPTAATAATTANAATTNTPTTNTPTTQ